MLKFLLFLSKKLTFYIELTLFMLTLAVGHTLSMIMDGLPTGGYIFGIIAEFTLGIYSVYQLKKHKTKRMETDRKSVGNNV